MPYTITQNGPSHATLRLWPHNTLAPRGFVVVIGLSALALALPMLALLGSPALWGLLPFAMAALAGLWIALQRNWRDRRITEEMRLTCDTVHLRHISPSGAAREWQAELPWVALTLTRSAGPVPQYLTLSGGGREVELGAFLTPQERLRLHDELHALLIRLKSHAGSN